MWRGPRCPRASAVIKLPVSVEVSAPGPACARRSAGGESHFQVAAGGSIRDPSPFVFLRRGSRGGGKWSALNKMQLYSDAAP